MNPALSQIKAILDYGVKEIVSKAEMQVFVNTLLKMIRQWKDSYDAGFKSLDGVVRKIGAEAKSDNKELVSDIVALKREIERVASTIPAPTDLSALEAQIAQIKTLSLEDVRAEVPKLATPIRDTLEALKGADRLNMSAIDGLAEALKDIRKFAQGGTGRLLGGVINVGARIEIPSGSANGSNTSFTVSKIPKYIVADGASYFQDKGYTLSGKTLTLTTAPISFVRSFY